MTGGGPARFVTFEGGEGSGKSTQARLFAEKLRAHGTPVLLTREPGGTPGAEAIRTLLVTGATDRWAPLTEALLMYAARAEHVARAIRPALDAGTWVVCDRFADSSMAYQGYGHGVPLDSIQALDRLVLAGLTPDLTVLIDLPTETGLARARARATSAGSDDQRFERLGTAFHERLSAGYRAMAAHEPRRFLIVDGRPPADQVAGEIWRSAAPRLGL